MSQPGNTADLPPLWMVLMRPRGEKAWTPVVVEVRTAEDRSVTCAFVIPDRAQALRSAGRLADKTGHETRVMPVVSVDVVHAAGRGEVRPQGTDHVVAPPAIPSVEKAKLGVMISRPQGGERELVTAGGKVIYWTNLNQVQRYCRSVSREFPEANPQPYRLDAGWTEDLIIPAEDVRTDETHESEFPAGWRDYVLPEEAEGQPSHV